MNIEKRLFNEAIVLIEQRYPTGWGGAAAMHTDEGKILTSVAPEVINDSTNLCIETGAILEAHKLDEKITHTICIVREDEHSPYVVLTPCGVCQERLFYWGNQVRAAVHTTDGSLSYRTLEEIQPYHWYAAYE